MKRSIDVPSLVTGIIALGFAGVSAWLLSGGRVPGEPVMWFAITLITAGIIGMVLSLRANSR